MDKNKESDKKISRTILVSCLPSDTNKNAIAEIFSTCGPIKKVFLVRNKDGTLNGVAYITYAEASYATEAVSKYNKFSLDGKTLHVKFSKQKDDDTKPIQIKEFKDEDEEINDRNRSYVSKKARKEVKQKARERKARLIIRNLSFKIDENQLKAEFSKLGEVVDVLILQKNGKKVGCGFVQYKENQSAINAIKAFNHKELFGRPVSVEFAIPKYKFDSNLPVIPKEEPEEIKVESGAEDDSMMDTSMTSLRTEIKEEVLSDEDKEDEESEESEEEEEEEDDVPEQSAPKRHKPDTKPEVSKDVTEQRTIFITNLSFDANEEDIRPVIEEFGPLKYVLLCYDKETGHTRGTAFAQYLKKESADACLEAADDSQQQDKFVLHGRTMKIFRAMGRKDITQKQEMNKNREQDSDKRNLYLASEGTIREGTAAAADLSKHDLEQRKMRKQFKQRLLKNLHTFISKTRLYIQNIPPNVTDKQLRQIFIENSPENSKITEAKIMRDLKDLDENNIGRSKGFGFISFDTHESALKALRKTNNNPDIFSKKKRPIVEFSLENRNALKARDRRNVKSKENNPYSKFYKADNNKKIEDSPSESFMGIKSDPKKKGKLGFPSHSGPKIRHRDQKPKIGRNQLRRDAEKTFGRKKKGNKKKGQVK